MAILSAALIKTAYQIQTRAMHEDEYKALFDAPIELIETVDPKSGQVDKLPIPASELASNPQVR